MSRLLPRINWPAVRRRVLVVNVLCGAIAFTAVGYAFGQVTPRETVTACVDGSGQLVVTGAGKCDAAEQVQLDLGPDPMSRNESTQVTLVSRSSGSQQDAVLTCPAGTHAVGPPALATKVPSGPYLVDASLHYNLIPSPVPWPDGPVKNYTVQWMGNADYELHAELTCISGVS